MIKKKAKSKKAAAKKSAKKKSSGKTRRETNPAEVRKEISKMVESHAKAMASAVIGDGEKGQLAPVKYLFEMAKIFPEAPDGTQATQEEDCLAKLLLDRLTPPPKAAREPDDEPAEAAAVKTAEAGVDERGGESAPETGAVSE